MRWLGLLGVLTAIGCQQNKVQEPSVRASMEINSSAFQQGGAIPARHSAYGDNISPALSWSGEPEGTKSFALIVDDPDAPRAEPFVHWVLFNIPASVHVIAEGKEPEGAVRGKNDRGELCYFGPRPPSGNHHYRFKIYALDSGLELTEGASKAELLKAMEGHVLARGELVGTFSKS